MQNFSKKKRQVLFDRIKDFAFSARVSGPIVNIQVSES